MPAADKDLKRFQRDFIREYLDVPRGLMSCCRDTISWLVGWLS